MASDWRQGSLVSPDDAVRLGLVPADRAGSARVLVISHSCDIAADAVLEPSVEVLVGELTSADKAKAFGSGHSIRQLSVSLANGAGKEEFHLYAIQERLQVPKEELERLSPWKEFKLDVRQASLLKRWLSQRYARAEFPDAFVAWLHESKVDEGIEAVAKAASANLRAIFFDLDDDEERADPNQPYELGIYLVYPADNPTAKAEAEAAVKKLADQFKRRCFVGGRWKWVELLRCEAISDESFSLAAADEFRKWRLEHRSVRGEPTVDPE